jgi:dTDP-4-dehydrorhamnose reductase
MKKTAKRILITGGSGFLGSHLFSLACQKFEAHATYQSNPINHANGFTYKVNLAEIKAINPLLDRVKPDAIIHTAAIANPDYCEQNKTEAETVNVLATQQIADWCGRNKSKLIFTSTDMVFNGEAGNYQESDSPDPKSFYAQTKSRAEKAVLNSNSQNIVARVALVYGMGIERKSSFFEQMVNRLRNGEHVSLFCDQFRSPILVNNLAEALLELAENDFSGIIHLGGSERISRWDFGLKACQVLNLPSGFIEKTSMHDFSTIAFRPGDISLDCSLANKVLKTKLLNCDEGLEIIKAMQVYESSGVRVSSKN